MSKHNKPKQLRGVLNVLSGTTTPIEVSKNGVIKLSRENRNIAKKK